MVSTKKFKKRNRSKIKYSNLKSAMKPVPHCDKIRVPKSPAKMQSSLESKSERIASDGEHCKKEINSDCQTDFTSSAK